MPSRSVPDTAPEIVLSKVAIKALLRLIIRERVIPDLLVEIEGQRYHAFTVLSLADEIGSGCADTSVGLTQLANANLITHCQLHQLTPEDDRSWVYITRFTEFGRAWADLCPADRGVA